MTHPLKPTLPWAAVRDRVCAVNAPLAEALDALDPPKRLHFSVEDFVYGQTLKPGALGLVLDGAIERVLKSPVAWVSKQLIRAGGLIGHTVEETLSCAHTRHYAGARSVLMLPTIGNFACHQGLQQAYRVTRPAPKGLREQAAIFAELAAKSQTPWRTTVLRFSPSWQKALGAQDPAWLALQHLIIAPKQAAFTQWQHQQLWHYLLSVIQAERHLKPNPYLIDTLHHLLSLMAAYTPGLAPASDESALPLHTLQQAYMESYRLEDYAPVIMQPAYLSDTPIYYSLQFPLLERFSPKASGKASLLSQLRELSYLLKIIWPRLLSQEWATPSALNDLFGHVKTQLFHIRGDEGALIAPTAQLADLDLRFTQSLKDQTRAFPISSSFLKACVQIEKTSR
ncbi:MAG: hypothetical protein COV52_06235 [Gammaproteobacteria bacterium CG11_big_fil_rev_8_21_14_0_20_46_22]|nr:MAG: hypothetical protein COW05_07425 [Gammaproteobacteria bacterium CG12_big_fil_rev_8_21_14_0_65_46_12]PIR11101.1 MAG: hypothetical protein COV52_06235 [Gammaproteobacteria bacterium CG11_big_fil_rev_8_21_14_0_20_46_22]